MYSHYIRNVFLKKHFRTSAASLCAYLNLRLREVAPPPCHFQHGILQGGQRGGGAQGNQLAIYLEDKIVHS